MKISKEEIEAAKAEFADSMAVTMHDAWRDTLRAAYTVRKRLKAERKAAEQKKAQETQGLRDVLRDALMPTRPKAQNGMAG
jgi:hypothetical protein